MLFSTTKLEPLAIIHDSTIQKMRCSATSALGIETLCNKDVRVAGLFGTGWQAQSHLQCMFLVLPTLEEVRVFSPIAADRKAFAQHWSAKAGRKVTAVDHPNFGVLVDMGNFLCADDEPASAVGRLMPYAFHCHAKDFHVKPGTDVAPGKGWFQSRAGNYLRGAILGHGNVPVLQCLRVMQRDGYQGVLSLEYEGIEDVLLGVQIGHDNLRRMVGMLAG